MSNSLMLHCGAREVSRSDLNSIEAPESTDTWFPIKHDTVLDAVETTLDKAGFSIGNSWLSIAKDGKRFFGVLDLRSGVGNSENLSIGIRNSNDKTFPIGFACGTRTFVCDNLAFSAEIVISKRHTRFSENRYREGIAHAVASLEQFREAEASRLLSLKERSLSEDEANSLILQSAEKKIVGWRKVPEILREWREPSHEEFEPRNSYSLLNAFTEVLKGRFEKYPSRTAYETINLQKLLVTDHTLAV